jgi:drug/metabolite transporter (DMT)-like permease
MNIEFKKKDIDSKGFNIMNLLLILLLLFGGLTDASSTIFEHTSDFKLKGLFLSIIFSSALFISLIILVILHRKISIKDILFGIGIGIPNYFSSFFLLNSLNSLDAVIVYPTYSVSTIVIITLVGVLFFKEKLKLNEIIGMVIIIGSIVLLNI